MRTSTVSAAFLLVGAGAAALAAVEPGGGNNLALNGSDTLFDVTKAVIASCGVLKPADGGPANGMGFVDFIGDHISYLGGGSGVGAGQMGLGLQELSPMSRAMKNSEYCTPGATAAGEGAAAANSEALLVGIDGVAITANQTNSCAASTGVATGLGAASFAVTGTCAGCDASGNYTLGADAREPSMRIRPRSTRWRSSTSVSATTTSTIATATSGSRSSRTGEPSSTPAAPARGTAPTA